MAATPPPAKGKGKQILGLNPVLFWGGLAVLVGGVAYFIYRRNAAKGQQAGADTQMLPVVVGGSTGLSTAQLLTWLHDHQGQPKGKPKVKPWPVDRPHPRPKPPPKKRRRGDH